MSLFQSREWWSVRGNAGAHCCVIANVDNEPGPGCLNKIVLGSLDGMLRMYYPRRREYKVDDLILEKMLEGPVLQLGVGKFVSGSRELCLAVLHPRRLVVLMVSAVSSGGAVNYYNVIECYGHELVRPSYNMSFGPFVGVQGRDYICVQSLDGVLSFFEQDAPAFKRGLPPQHFVAPGPLIYVQKTDTFVTADSQMCLHAYRYSVLAAAADNVDDGGDGGQQSGQRQSAGGGMFGDSSAGMMGGAAGGMQQHGGGKRVQVDWSVNVGEHPQFLFFARMMRTVASQESIVVVGERHLYYIKENGEIQMQKRIESEVACATVYPVRESAEMGAAGQNKLDGGFHNLILGTHSGHLMILRETQVVWCSQLNHVPMLVEVSEIGGLKGMITTLDEDGLLEVSYLGTDPPTAALVNTEMKELNYGQMEEEHQRLLMTIRESHGDGRREPTDKLTMTAQLSPHCKLVDDDETTEDIASIDGMALEGNLRLVASLQGVEEAEKLTFLLDTPGCFVPSQKMFYFSKMKKSSSGGGTPLVIPVTFKILNQVLASGLSARATCTYYVGSSSEPRCSVCEFEMPLSWVVRPIPPIKSANYKIQFDCTRAPPPLTEVFSDIFEQPQYLQGRETLGYSAR